jgi:hypothetical protein
MSDLLIALRCVGGAFAAGVLLMLVSWATMRFTEWCWRRSDFREKAGRE